MAIIGIMTKQPWEATRLTIDYSSEVGNLSLDSLVADVAVPTGMALVSQVVSGNQLQLYVEGGDDGQTYAWRVRSTLTAGGAEIARVEDEFLVLVEEVVGDVGDPDGAFVAAGAQVSRIDQTDGDELSYLIDCAALLRPYELLTGITSLTPGTGLTATGQVLRQGRYLEVTLAGTADAGQPYTDRTLRAVFTSTRGTVRGSITLRVYPA